MKNNYIYFCISIGMILISSCSSLPGKTDVRSLDIKNKAAEYQKEGISQYNSGRFSQALDLFDLAYQLNTSVDNEEGIVITLNSIGKTKLAEIEYEEAFENFTLALNISKRLNNESLIMSTIGNLGDYYVKIDELDTAYKLLLTELEKIDKINSEESASLANSISLVLRKLGKYDEALNYLNQSLNYNLKNNSYRALASDYYMLSSINSLQQNYIEAFSYAMEALKYDKMIEFSLGIAVDLEALSIISEKMGNQEDAELYINRSNNVLNAIGNINEIEQTELENN